MKKKSIIFTSWSTPKELLFRKELDKVNVSEMDTSSGVIENEGKNVRCYND